MPWPYCDAALSLLVTVTADNVNDGDGRLMMLHTLLFVLCYRMCYRMCCVIVLCYRMLCYRIHFVLLLLDS